jgi:hypothetical protein
MEQLPVRTSAKNLRICVIRLAFTNVKKKSLHETKLKAVVTLHGIF